VSKPANVRVPVPPANKDQVPLTAFPATINARFDRPCGGTPLDILLITLTLKMCAALLLAVLPVAAKTNSGETIEGDLAGFTSNEVRIESSGGVREIPFDQLTTLSPASIDDRSGPTMRVALQT
jgi:hypothetical protein